MRIHLTILIITLGIPMASHFTGTTSGTQPSATTDKYEHKKEDQDIIKHLDMFRNINVYKDFNLYRYINVFDQEDK